MTREEIIEKVFRQIKEDVYMDDFTAIAQLIVKADNKTLEDFLSEKDTNE